VAVLTVSVTVVTASFICSMIVGACCFSRRLVAFLGRAALFFFAGAAFFFFGALRFAALGRPRLAARAPVFRRALDFFVDLFAAFLAFFAFRAFAMPPSWVRIARREYSDKQPLHRRF
jgi:hypothetical protein